jgi:glycine betaine/choline ABC-type transport system substrate-binding protein
MKKRFSLLVVVLLLSMVQISSACVGRTLHIGVPNSTNDKLLAEIVSLLISERTGSAVAIQVYKESKDIYSAAKKGDVNIILENTSRAMEIIGKPKESYSKAMLETIKSGYKKNFNMIWLEPFSAQNYAPVLTSDTLANYPALPKLLNKLAGVLNSENYARLVKSSGPDDRLKKIARDFLKSKKLI